MPNISTFFCPAQGANVPKIPKKSNINRLQPPPVAPKHKSCYGSWRRQKSAESSKRPLEAKGSGNSLRNDNTTPDAYPWCFKRDAFVLSCNGPLTNFYDVESKTLGKGTYGSVNRAVNKSTKVVRAVKTIPKAKVKNVRRFKLEIGIMKELDHPNIIKLFETFEDPKCIYLVLELCRGGELFDRILEEGYFSEMYAGVLMRSIISALFYLHKHGIVHRDLKPENFMFLDKGKESPLKVIDFGLAARFNGNSYMSTKAGTPYYVAPQVLQGKYTYKCDMWSAGVILYILLCGYPPFHGETDAEILSKVRTGKYSFNEADWRGISSDAQDLIRKLIVFDPHQRLTAEQALNHPWIRHYATKNNPAAEAPLSRHIIENFRSFRAVTKLKKAALTIIAQQLNENQLEELKNVFLGLDENCDGTLTVQEMRSGLKRAGFKDMPADLEALILEIDSDGSGVIDYTEFLAASLDKRQYIQEDLCWAAFRVFDVDANGKISAQDLCQVLQNAKVQGVEFPMSPSTIQSPNDDAIADVKKSSAKEEIHHLSQIKDIIKEVDRNGDGEIDFTEFMDMMRRGSIKPI